MAFREALAGCFMSAAASEHDCSVLGMRAVSLHEWRSRIKVTLGEGKRRSRSCLMFSCIPKLTLFCLFACRLLFVALATRLTLIVRYQTAKLEILNEEKRQRPWLL